MRWPGILAAGCLMARHAGNVPDGGRECDPRQPRTHPLAALGCAAAAVGCVVARGGVRLGLRSVIFSNDVLAACFPRPVGPGGQLLVELPQDPLLVEVECGHGGAEALHALPPLLSQPPTSLPISSIPFAAKPYRFR